MTHNLTVHTKICLAKVQCLPIVTAAVSAAASGTAESTAIPRPEKRTSDQLPADERIRINGHGYISLDEGQCQRRRQMAPEDLEGQCSKLRDDAGTVRSLNVNTVTHRSAAVCSSCLRAPRGCHPPTMTTRAPLPKHLSTNGIMHSPSRCLRWYPESAWASTWHRLFPGRTAKTATDPPTLHVGGPANGNMGSLPMASGTLSASPYSAMNFRGQACQDVTRDGTQLRPSRIPFHVAHRQIQARHMDPPKTSGEALSVMAFATRACTNGVSPA